MNFNSDVSRRGSLTRTLPSRSNTHRVVPAPGDQGLHDRWSLGYFLRPSYASKMYPLSHLSEKIAAAAATSAMISE